MASHACFTCYGTTQRCRDSSSSACQPLLPIRHFFAIHRRNPGAATTPLYAKENRKRAALFTCRAAPEDVFVLDFDGVIADSQLEVSTAGLEAALQVWPETFGNLSDTDRARILKNLSQARPRVVRGYETMVMARLVWESEDNLAKILKPDWAEKGGLFEQTLSAWNASAETLQQCFEAFRANRMKMRPDAWLSLNPLYFGVAEAIEDCPAPFYICSSKRSDRLLPLLNVSLKLNVDKDSPRVFADLIPPNECKIAALREIMVRPVAANPSTTLHFIDDRYDTIAAVAAEPDVAKRYSLYLAAWGYNTAEERAAARTLPGVTVIDLPFFCELLRFGIIMNVMDGCQDLEDGSTN